MNEELEVAPIDKENKVDLLAIGEEGSMSKALSEGSQLPALVDGSVVISSKLQAHDHINPSYQISKLSIDELAAGDMFDPYNGALQLVLKLVREAMTNNDKRPVRVPFSVMYGFEDEQAMSLVDPDLLERAANICLRSEVGMGIVVQSIDSLKAAYTYEVKAPMSEKKRFRLWLRIIFRDKRRKKVVVINQKELSAPHQQLLEAALEKHKEKPFRLCEFHQLGGVKGGEGHHEIL